MQTLGQRKIILCFLLTVLALLAPWHKAPAYAQKDQTLEELVTGDKNSKKSGVKSGADLAYDFFEKCSTDPDYFVKEKTQKEYCRCKAEKMSTSLSRSELLNLKEDSERGSIARDHMRMYADSVCMSPAIKSYTYGVCMKDPQFKKILLGKSEICKCMSRYVDYYIGRQIPNILVRASTQEPLSLDALSFFLRSPEYDQMYGMYRERCYTEVTYSQANK
ncbi:MAG: hypothetical protein H6858_04190 [Rhodospirillales bacterium]|nr:hypothetical protein [Alphaproteobacteria bacterium]MCB1840748.1 hypothetical protein [Alphaproteobacteria bacterium]MCB9976784.1 hypothetical protein [Rhodospirillales bacterium]